MSAHECPCSVPLVQCRPRVPPGSRVRSQLWLVKFNCAGPRPVTPRVIASRASWSTWGSHWRCDGHNLCHLSAILHRTSINYQLFVYQVDIRYTYPLLLLLQCAVYCCHIILHPFSHKFHLEITSFPPLPPPSTHHKLFYGKYLSIQISCFV